jgi:hypothetical protein
MQVRCRCDAGAMQVRCRSLKGGMQAKKNDAGVQVTRGAGNLQVKCKIMTCLEVTEGVHSAGERAGER